MPLIIPPALVSAITEGRAVLFLGAGASRGAKDADNKDIPDGKALAVLLQEKYLGPDYEGLDLRSTYDLACNQRDVRTVQEYLCKVFNPMNPADFHKIIPTFSWAGLLTTNYDLIIERAYKSLHPPLQKLIPNSRDGDGSTDQLADRTVLYVKLHGCLTRHSEVKPPMIASTEQLIAFRDGREGQFSTFLEWAKTKTIIFCGYAFLDSNLRILFDEIIKEGDNRPRHYIINKGLRPAEQDYWRERRVEAIDASFEEFLRTLDATIPATTKTLGVFAQSASNTSSFHRFISVAGKSESPELLSYLKSFIEHIGPDVDPSDADPARFYSGFDLGWYPAKTELDVRQSIVDEVLKDHVIPTPDNSLPIVVIKGHAGSGKSVSLRRICYDAATKLGKVCFYVSRQHIIQPERFEEIFGLTNQPIYLFVDNVSEHRDRVAELIRLARKMNALIKIVATETYSTWNILCDDLETFVSDILEMRYLSERNIENLLEKLEKYDCLGYLKNMSADKRKHELSYVHGRQILVALLEATHGAPLLDLVANEYRDIPSAQAKLLYLDICSLHRFGPPVRAGLISRLHNISFDDFKAQLFKPLEAIVVLREDKRSGDYVYEARHSYIAHTVYEAVMTSQEQRFDNIVRIITKLNPSYSYDLEVVGHLVRAEMLQRIIPDHAKVRQVYDVAEASLGERAVLFHQRGIFEMHVAGNLGQFDVAERLFLKAISIEPYNRSFQHSLAELDLRRSQAATDPLERQAWRQRAVDKASALITRGSSPYPYHTLLKAGIDNIKDALVEADAEETEASDLRLGECITAAEAVLKKGLQQFPNEAILLAGEGELSKVLSLASRAEKAFGKSFTQNPRSTLIARKLARIKRAKGAFDEATAILQKSLEFNPSAQDVHYDFAMTILDSAPDADQTQGDELLYHLRRSFAPGDKNYQAQFWYARQLCVMSKFEDARPLFKSLMEGRIPYREKTTEQGELRGRDGLPRELIGSISHLRETFGFIKCGALNLDAFFSVSQHAQECADYLDNGASVRFNLSFTLRGPVAINIRM